MHLNPDILVIQEAAEIAKFRAVFRNREPNRIGHRILMNDFPWRVAVGTRGRAKGRRNAEN